MARISKTAATIDGLLVTLAKVIDKWSPEEATRELAYRDSLLRHLRETLPEDAVVEKEYRHLGTTVDIWIKWKGHFIDDEVAIEMKLHLTKKTECDRLVGQLELLEPKKNKVIALLMGEADEQLYKRIAAKYEQQLRPPIGSLPTMLLLRKRSANSAA